MDASAIHAGGRYINAFGTTYVVHEIDQGIVVYTIHGIRMGRIRMEAEAFAIHMVREVKDGK